MAVSDSGSPYRIHMPHWPQPLFYEPVGTVHSRMQELLARLGNPQHALTNAVHVAGTNGKGSTIAFLRAFMEAAGLRVHAYISPHLQYFEERITLASSIITPAALHALLERVRVAAGDDLAVRFFEGTTAAAYLAFAETQADVALIECGMGGAGDATNQLVEPACTIITPISEDHVDYLGPTLADIALHKAGIMKPGVPCIVGPQLPAVRDILLAQADAIGAPVLGYGQHWASQLVMHEGERYLRYADIHGEVFLPAPNLPGAHQAANAGMAIAALTVLDRLDVQGDAIAEGLQHTRWPARLERIGRGPLAASMPLGWELWLDGGHNADGAQAIAAHIEKEWADAPTYLIFGTTRGKALGPILASLLPRVAQAYAVPVAAEPKCYRPGEILGQAPAAMELADSVADAVQEILASGAKPGRILIFGSLYLRVETAG